MSWGFNRSGERFGHALPADGAGGTAPTSDWLLATGQWDDAGFWRDDENWND